jgi:hypothetical protein
MGIPRTSIHVLKVLSPYLVWRTCRIYIYIYLYLFIIIFWFLKNGHLWFTWGREEEPSFLPFMLDLSLQNSPVQGPYSLPGCKELVEFWIHKKNGWMSFEFIKERDGWMWFRSFFLYMDGCDWFEDNWMDHHL